jgi:exonuclease III
MLSFWVKLVGSQILAAVPSDVRGLCDGLITRPRKKTLITKEKEEKMGQINTMKTNSKRKKNLRLATWNVRSLYRPGGLRITINELRKYKIAIAAIQETRWNKFTPQAFTSNGYNIYTSSLANNHGFGTTFLVDSKFNHMVINLTPINERLCVIRIKGKFFNYSFINIHAPTNDSEEEAKDQFYEQLERAYAPCPSHDVKLVIGDGDANAKVGRETEN